MRISATTLESYRLWRQPDQDWMPESDLRNTIEGAWMPTHKVSLGQAFGKVLEDPDRYLVPGGFRCEANGETFEFGADVLEPCLALIDRRGVFEAKAVKSYGPYEVVSKADHLLGADLSEFKTTLSTFDFERYAASCQWRFMADAFQPRRITYHVFCLDEATNGVIGLKDIHSFNLYPYADLSLDCWALVQDFVAYVNARGLGHVLKARQAAA